MLAEVVPLDSVEDLVDAELFTQNNHFVLVHDAVRLLFALVAWFGWHLSEIFDLLYLLLMLLRVIFESCIFVSSCLVLEILPQHILFLLSVPSVVILSTS